MATRKRDFGRHVQPTHATLSQREVPTDYVVLREFLCPSDFWKHSFLTKLEQSRLSQLEKNEQYREAYARMQEWKSDIQSRKRGIQPSQHVDSFIAKRKRIFEKCRSQTQRNEDGDRAIRVPFLPWHTDESIDAYFLAPSGDSHL